MPSALDRYARELDWSSKELEAIEADMNARKGDPGFDEASFAPRFHQVRLAHRRVKDGLRRDKERQHSRA